jgi:drug/metabolite transporter (DMT)-like permease
MPGSKNIYLHLHLLVFIWGFTAILGKLISLDAVTLVWYRIFFTVISIFAFLKIAKIDYRLKTKAILQLFGIGVIIAFHWSTFFLAIKVANVSIALAGLSTGAFFVSIIEPIINRKKPVLYEVLLGVVVIVGISLILDVEGNYKTGAMIALVSAFLSAFFSVFNGKIAHKWDASVITFYQMLGGVITLSLVIPFMSSDMVNFTVPTGMDLVYLIILATICTAYTFIAVVKIMKTLSAFTVVLTVNLEPVYGIIMAFFIFGESETMSPKFYIGTIVIVSTVFINSWLKGRKVKKSIEVNNGV